MARGGSKRRTYVRDANGRFASTPGGGSKSLAAARKAARPTSGRKGTLQARTSLKKSRNKLASHDPADQRLTTALSVKAQKGAVTRGIKKLNAAKDTARTKLRTTPRPSTVRLTRNDGRLLSQEQQSSKKTNNLTKGPKVKLPKIATPNGAMRKSDFTKIQSDAQKGIGTPFSRAAQRSIARSAREAPLARKKAIADAQRKGMTGFGKGPKMNTRSIGNNEFAWNRQGEPATKQERLTMWQKSERRLRGFWSSGRGVTGAYAGDLRASRRAAQLVDSGSRLGDLPTTRKLAEQPRQRRLARLEANKTKANLEWSKADQTIKPKIDKLQAKIKERQATGKKATQVQVNNLRELVNQYNKSVRGRQIADAAKSYYDSPWTYKPKRMSGSRVDQSLKESKPPSRVKGSRTRLPGMGGVVAKPKGLKPAALKRQTKLTPTRITGRPKEQQDKRNLIARALREMPKEKRAKFIKARKEIEAEQSQKTVRESARIVNSSQSQPSIQKQRWAKKAEIYANAAMKNKEKAASLESAAGRFSRDWNFISQPGNFSARKKVNSQQDKAFELRRKARQQELRAEELRRLATTNKGDAERKRQSQRDKVSVEKGSRISTLVYGPGKVVRVNKKTVSYLIDRTGSVINVDKSWVINS